MLILAIHQTPSLTQEKYEEVVRRLTVDQIWRRTLWTPVEQGTAIQIVMRVR